MSSKDAVGSAEKSAPEQQMLTPQEISDRRKARRLLEQKGVALEEAVEKRICERVYKRIWRHRSTLDEVRDEKLRSRTAALALVGIGLEDLGIKVGQPLVDSQNTEALKDLQIDEWMSKARDGLFKMNDVKSPKEKLEHLAATHKSIVDMLTKFHQSSSSADEILPTLIYTLITTPPEGINVISNLNFTQRFRAANKIDGEAAYCLTNLEAAISFLETVDLASLRSDEALEGPPKSASRPSTPRDDCHSEWPINAAPSSTGVFADSITPATTSSPRSDPVMVSNPLESPGLAKLPHPANATNPRRSSNLFQPQIDAIEAAGDAVRSTADQGLKNIGNSLDNSFRFLFGRLKEHHLKNDHAEAKKGPILPRTLDDARKLVDPESNFDEEIDAPGASSAAEHSDPQAETYVKMEDRLLGLFGGQRDRSADSAQSSGSGKRAGFAPENTKINDKAGSPSQLPAVTSTPPSHSPQPESNNVPNAAVESMRNLGNTLNPLNRLAGMNVMRGFGRTSSHPSPAATSALTRTEKPLPDPWETISKDKVMAAPRQDSTQTTRPIQRFLDVADASELKIGEIEELLKDYKRLASDLKKFVQNEQL